MSDAVGSKLFSDTDARNRPLRRTRATVTSFAVVLAISALPPPLGAIGERQQNPVGTASVTVDVVSGRAEVVAHVRNDHQTLALEAWQIRLVADTGGDVPYTVDITTDTYAGIGRTGRGPLGPGQTRDFTFPVAAAPRSASATVLMVLWEDFSSEGAKAVASAVLAKRERDADTIDVWLKTVNSIAGRPPAEAQATVRAVLASERKRLGPLPTDPLAISLCERFESALASDDATQLSAARLSPLVSRLEEQRRSALRHKRNR